MADQQGRLDWYAPDPRAVIPLDGFKVSRSLRATYRRGTFECAVDRDFETVIRACAERADGTWISDEIVEAYCELHRLGFAHSVEAWQDDALVGGLYGVSIGGAFFGESMFHRATDASKVALVFLVEEMRRRGLVLLDVQFVTDHLKQFGIITIPRQDYQARLKRAIRMNVRFVEGDAVVEIHIPD